MENNLTLMPKPDQGKQLSQSQNPDDFSARDQELEQLLAPMRAETVSELQLYRWQKAVKQEISSQQKARSYQPVISMVGCLVIGFMLGGSLFGTFFPQQVKLPQKPEISQKPEAPIATCSFSDSSALAKNASSSAPSDVLYIKIR